MGGLLGHEVAVAVVTLVQRLELAHVLVAVGAQQVEVVRHTAGAQVDGLGVDVGVRAGLLVAQLDAGAGVLVVKQEGGAAGVHANLDVGVGGVGLDLLLQHCDGLGAVAADVARAAGVRTQRQAVLQEEPRAVHALVGALLGQQLGVLDEVGDASGLVALAQGVGPLQALLGQVALLGEVGAAAQEAALLHQDDLGLGGVLGRDHGAHEAADAGAHHHEVGVLLGVGLVHDADLVDVGEGGVAGAGALGEGGVRGGLVGCGGAGEHGGGSGGGGHAGGAGDHGAAGDDGLVHNSSSPF